MASLKHYLPALARIVGTTPGALYERQRELVRADILPFDEGRGPGSGTKATTFSVGFLLISLLGSESLSGSAGRVRALKDAKPVGAKRCPLTNAKTFGGALDAVLVATEKALSVVEITIVRTADVARIRYESADGERTVEFRGERTEKQGITIAASIDRESIRLVADDIQAILNAEEED